MSARTPLIAGNWKMYKTEAQAEEYIQALLPLLSSVDGVEVAICVPFTDLRAMVDSARGSRVEVYAQNMHQEPEGAFTGEVSPAMLSDVGVQGVVLGHSERRACFGETDRALALKVSASIWPEFAANGSFYRMRIKRFSYRPLHQAWKIKHCLAS